MSKISKRRHYSLPNAKAHLSAVDATMAQLIVAVGASKVRSEAELTVFQSLVRAIVYQMLSTKSAAAIYQRLLASCDDEVTVQSIKAMGDFRLKEIGFSRAKVASVLDLCARKEDGTIPCDELLIKMSDEELIDCLTQVKGIGRWSVEMLMIFNLGRADVFPATDLGVRKGHMMAYGLTQMLSATELLKQSKVWKPYRTVAAWYLWRATDSVDWESISL